MGIKQAKTTKASDDSKDFPTVQITYLERVSEAVTANPYGLHTNPPKNTPALLITLNRDEASQFVIPLNTGIRPKGLKECEVITGNFKVGSTIKFDENGNVDITCKGNLNANVDGDCTSTIAGNTTITCPQTTINGNLIVNGDISSSGNLSASGDISGGGIDLVTHIHDGVQTGSGNTGEPV